MIRHIVFFRYKPEVNESARTRFEKALAALDSIPEVGSLCVARDEGRTHNSYDTVLDSTFDDLAAVGRYAVHPDHVKVLEMVRELCIATAKVDFTP